MTEYASNALLVTAHNADHQRVRELAAVNQSYSDWVVFNNRRAWDELGQEKSCNISNGVDLKFFKVLYEGESRPEKAVWTGGFGKGLFDFLNPLREKCKESKFNIHLKPISSGAWDKNQKPKRTTVWGMEKMIKWYNGAKYVLCCSETDSTPNYILEAMACGCVPITTQVGNAMEFGQQFNNVVFAPRDLDAFHSALLYARENFDRLQAESLKTIRQWGWDKRALMYFDLFDRLLNKEKIEKFSYMEIENGT